MWLEDGMKNWGKQSSRRTLTGKGGGCFYILWESVCIYGIFIPDLYHQELASMLSHNSIQHYAATAYELPQGHTSREE